MKRAKSGVIRRPRLAQADIPLDHLDDVGLLLDGLGEVGHGGCIEDKALKWSEVEGAEGETDGASFTANYS